MRRFFQAVCITVALTFGTLTLVSTPGCTTSQQTTTYNTLFSLEKSVTAAYSVYVDLVIAGKAPAANLASISQKYNLFQASFKVAADAAQFNVNALADQNLVTLANDVINAITVARGGK
jgi:hypothetical protein